MQLMIKIYMIYYFSKINLREVRKLNEISINDFNDFVEYPINKYETLLNNIYLQLLFNRNILLKI